MPHATWKGSISFGLVSIPIGLYTSKDKSTAISFRQIDRRDKAKIKYERVNADTGKEVNWDNIQRGYEYEKNVIIPVADDELKRIAGENAHTIAIEEFVDKKSIRLIDIANTYILAPEKKGEKGYVILREALKKANKVGIAKVIISTREYLSAVSVFENALVLYILHYQDEIRDLSDFNLPTEDLAKYKVTKNEITIATKLIDSMSAKWQPARFKDEYKKAVQEWVSHKVKHLPTKVMKPHGRAGKKTNVVDFVSMLKKSLETQKPAKRHQNDRSMKKSRVHANGHGKKKSHRRAEEYA